MYTYSINTSYTLPLHNALWQISIKIRRNIIISLRIREDVGMGEAFPNNTHNPRQELTLSSSVLSLFHALPQFIFITFPYHHCFSDEEKWGPERSNSDPKGTQPLKRKSFLKKKEQKNKQSQHLFNATLCKHCSKPFTCIISFSKTSEAATILSMRKLRHKGGSVVHGFPANARPNQDSNPDRRTLAFKIVLAIIPTSLSCSIKLVDVCKLHLVHNKHFRNIIYLYLYK